LRRVFAKPDFFADQVMPGFFARLQELAELAALTQKDLPSKAQMMEP
jgi:hypothetical protein